MINLTINGEAYQVPEGYTIQAACAANGIEVPTLCFLKDVSNVGSCRVCVVEVEGMSKLPSSCNTLCTEGMVIHTNTPRVVTARRAALNLILSNHHQDCFSCAANGVCELQKLCNDYGVLHTTYDGTRYQIEMPAG